MTLRQYGICFILSFPDVLFSLRNQLPVPLALRCASFFYQITFDQKRKKKQKYRVFDR